MNVAALSFSVQSSFLKLLAWNCLICGLALIPQICAVESSQAQAETTEQSAEQAELGARPKSALDKRKPRPKSFARPFLIELTGDIDPSDTAFLRNRLQRAKASKADLLIIEIDSPGGYKTESLAIGEMLRDLDWAYVIAYVPREAISGGALLSFGADEIYCSPDMRFGDIGPIQFDPTEFAFRLVPAKLQSVLVREARDLAEAKGYPPDLAEAMVDKDVLVYQRRGADGKLEFRRSHLNDQEKPDDDWTLIEESGPERFLTLNGARAKELGIVTELAADRAELVKQLGLQSEKLTVFKVNAADRVARVLNSWWATALLIVIGMLALYLEISSPGIGIGALVSGLCAMLFFWSHFLGGTADWLEVLLFLAGLVFLAMELFVIPGWGISGLLGLLLILTSTVMATQDFVVPSNGEQWNQFLTSLLTLLCALALVFLGAVLITKKIGTIPVFNQMVLAPQPDPEVATESNSAKTKPAKPGVVSHPAVSVGDWGKTDSPLRPAGRANFNGLSLDVISDGQFVEQGQQVKVVRIQGNVVVVSPIEA
jgi:membrane-bound serine protease (ClpP class)